MKLSNTQQKYIGAIVTHASDVGVDINKVNFSRAELRLISILLTLHLWKILTSQRTTLRVMSMSKQCRRCPYEQGYSNTRSSISTLTDWM